MFPQLSNYLLQYSEVGVPGVGHFELAQQPARLAVMDNLLQPPSYVVRYSQKEAVKEHQLACLAADLNTDIDAARQQLEAFGGQLAERLKQEPFYWNGIGRLESSGNSIRFHPDVIDIEGWQPIPVEMVIRQNPAHTILVGEQEMDSAGVRELLQPAKQRKFNLQAPVAWMVVLIALIFILIYLSLEGWQATSSGNRVKLNVEKQPATYKSH